MTTETRGGNGEYFVYEIIAIEYGQYTRNFQCTVVKKKSFQYENFDTNLHKENVSV